MIVQLIKPWRRWPVGHKFTEMTDGVANLLERRGIANVLVDDTKASRVDSTSGRAGDDRGSPQAMQPGSDGHNARRDAKSKANRRQRTV